MKVRIALMGIFFLWYIWAVGAPCQKTKLVRIILKGQCEEPVLELDQYYFIKQGNYFECKLPEEIREFKPDLRKLNKGTSYYFKFDTSKIIDNGIECFILVTILVERKQDLSVDSSPGFLPFSFLKANRKTPWVLEKISPDDNKLTFRFILVPNRDIAPPVDFEISLADIKRKPKKNLLIDRGELLEKAAKAKMKEVGGYRGVKAMQNSATEHVLKAYLLTNEISFKLQDSAN